MSTIVPDLSTVGRITELTAPPAVPFEFVIWDAQQCADYLGESKGKFLGRTQYLEGFPARCPRPGHPRWPAKAVCEWALGSRQDHGSAA